MVDRDGPTLDDLISLSQPAVAVGMLPTAQRSAAVVEAKLHARLRAIANDKDGEKGQKRGNAFLAMSPRQLGEALEAQPDREVDTQVLAHDRPVVDPLSIIDRNAQQMADLAGCVHTQIVSSGQISLRGLARAAGAPSRATQS